MFAKSSRGLATKAKPQLRQLRNSNCLWVNRPRLNPTASVSLPQILHAGGVLPDCFAVMQQAGAFLPKCLSDLATAGSDQRLSPLELHGLDSPSRIGLSAGRVNEAVNGGVIVRAAFSRG